MNTNKIVIHKVHGYRAFVIPKFFAMSICLAGESRIDILMVKFWRSINDVEIFSGFGWPLKMADMLSAGG